MIAFHYLYALLKNKTPKVRFLAINILQDRDAVKLFHEETKAVGKRYQRCLLCIWMFGNRTSAQYAHKTF